MFFVACNVLAAANCYCNHLMHVSKLILNKERRGFGQIMKIPAQENVGLKMCILKNRILRTQIMMVGFLFDKLHKFR